MTAVTVAGVVTIPRALVMAHRGIAVFSAQMTHARPSGDIEMFTRNAAGDFIVPRHHPDVESLIAPLPKRVVNMCGGGSFVWSGNLRDGQLDGQTRVLETLRRERGCMVVGETGSGKTVLSLYIISAINPKTAMIMVDQLNLVEQWIKQAIRFLPGVTIEIMAGDADARAFARDYDLKGTGAGRLILATPQSVYRSTRYTVDSPLCVDLLGCDEAHSFAAPTFCGAIMKLRFTAGMGMTATPDRKDKADAVFHSFLGRTHVVFAGEVMDPEVHIVPGPSCDIDQADWGTAYCCKFHQRVTPQDCSFCDHQAQLPDCGKLPTNKRGGVAWGPVDFIGILQAMVRHPDYVAWAKDGVSQLMLRRRRIFFFTTTVAVLIELYAWAVEQYGEDEVGLLVSTKNCPKEYRKQLPAAATKRLTFCTYKKGEKGLDVANKDAMVIGTPVTDIRQVAGRVRRIDENKMTPVVMLPVPDIGVMKGMARKLVKQCKEKNWAIRDPHKLMSR